MIDSPIIYTTGVDAMATVLKGVALFLNGNVFMRILKLTIALGGFWILLSMIFKANINKQSILRSAVTLFVWAILLTPVVTVHLKDPLVGHQRAVNNVPIVPALIASAISQDTYEAMCSKGRCNTIKQEVK